MTSASTEIEPDTSQGDVTFGRIALGVFAAVLAPAIVFSLLMLLEEFPAAEDLGAMKMIALPGVFAFGLVLTAVFTVPAAFVFGLPTIAVFRRLLNWHDWPRHAAAGALIGALVGSLISSAFPRSEDAIGVMLAFTAAGIFSITMYWITVYGRNRKLLLTGTMALGLLFFWILTHLGTLTGLSDNTLLS